MKKFFKNLNNFLFEIYTALFCQEEDFDEYLEKEPLPYVVESMFSKEEKPK